MKDSWGGFFRFRRITSLDFVPEPGMCSACVRHEVHTSPQSTTDTQDDLILDGPFAETKEHAISV